MTQFSKEIHSLTRTVPDTSIFTHTGGVTSIGGFQIIRRLATGSTADILLARAELGQDESATVVIKRHRASQSASPLREAAALSQVSHSHVIRLLDVATTDAGDAALIIERCDPAGLAGILSRGEELTAGELVTIAVPLFDAVEHLHQRGIAHTRIGAHKILFNAVGAPVLVGLSHAECAVPADGFTGAPLLAERLVHQDWQQLVALVGELAYRVPRPPAGLVDLLSWLDTAPWAVDSDDFAATVQDRFFTSAEPEPVTFGAKKTTGSAAVASFARSIPPADSSPAQPEHPPFSSVLASVAGRLLSSRADLSRFAAALGEQVRSIRRRFWVMSAIALVSWGLITAVISAPQSSTAGADGETPVMDALGLDRSTDEGENADDESLAHAEMVRGDFAQIEDPIDAAKILLGQREQCFTSLSLDCLDTVAALESPALAQDRAMMLAKRGENTPVTHAHRTLAIESLMLSDRWGDTALVAGTEATEPEDKTQPASVLLVRTEAGWRIRLLAFIA